jgi:Bax protein
MSVQHFFRSMSRRIDRRKAVIFVAALIVLVVLPWLYIDSVTSLPDFRQYEAGPERKKAFFTFMRPLIKEQNDRIRADRARLRAFAEGRNTGWFDRRWVGGLADEYGIEDGDPDDPAVLQQLIRRVDIVPMSLALAQAAKESGWGTSRFARDGNNLFGEWCFDEGCGLVPRSRSTAASHEVETFFAPKHSVESYLDNINTHDKYRSFRNERARMRAEDRTLSGIELADELSQYSERREAYVKEIRALIVTNDLEQPPEKSSD